MVYSPGVVGLDVGADERLAVGAYEIGESDDEKKSYLIVSSKWMWTWN